MKRHLVGAGLIKCLLTDESANTSTIACSGCLFSENYGDHNVYMFYQSTLKIKDVSPILNPSIFNSGRRSRVAFTKSKTPG